MFEYLFELLFKYPRDLYARSSLTYLGQWPDWLLPALALIAVLAIAGFLFSRRRQAPASLLAGIGASQAAMVALALWLLTQPALETEELREGENAIAALLDTSGSMAHGESESRLLSARRLLSSAEDASASLAFSVQRFVFDEAARPVDSFESAAPSGEQSRIADALVRVLDSARSSPLAAVLIASDGADTSGRLDVDTLAKIAAYGVPVHSLPVGRSVMPEDLELTSVAVPARVLPNSTVTARVSIRHDGAGEAQLRVYDSDELLASVPVALDPDATGSTMNVDFELSDVGPHELEFSISRVDDELELRNNRRAALVDVVDERWRVLYFEGEPRWEYKFMRRAVDGADIQLETLLRVSPNKFYRQGIDSPDRLADGFPATREELFAYDALIIGSVEAATLTPEQQLMVRDFVGERGGSLLMLGGRNGLGNGGWAQSSVADALPATLPATGDNSFHRVHTGVALTLQGSAAPMLQFDASPEENDRLWRELPEVADYQLVGELKPAAVALLEAQTATGPAPLMITQAFGRGRSYILATGGTWRWQMSLPVEDQRHELFWRQLLRTLVANAPAPTTLTATTGAGGNGIALRAEFRDESFSAVNDVTVSAVVAAADGESWTVTMQPSSTDSGVYIGHVDPGRSGAYFAEAVAARGDDPVEVARASLSYEAGQAEHFGVRANPALLSRISDATGGRTLSADELGSLPDLLRYSSAGITEIETRPIWDAPAFFLLLLLIKAGEWLLRRRRGTI